MNSVHLIGRLTKDTELQISGQNQYVRFNLAVNRDYTKEDGTRDADFINCVAWNKTAELINKHFKRGSEFGAEGRIQTGSYDNAEGKKVYTTDVVVEKITFVGSKKEERPAPEYVGSNNNQISNANNSTDNLSDDPFLAFGLSNGTGVVPQSELPF